MRRRIVVTTAGGAAIALLFLFARPSLPTAVGGQTTYLHITGRSMLPQLVTDDIVGVRPSSPYGVGDVVAYRNPDLGIVVHRIVAWDGDRLVLRGDNNSSEDAYRAEVSDVIGTRVVRLPGAARYVPASPFVVPVVLGSLTLLATVLLHIWRARRRGKAATANNRPPAFVRTALLTSCSLAVIFVILAIVLQVVGRTVPATAVEQDAMLLHHVGTLAYSGGPTVDLAQSGFPVFRSDGGAVAVRFDYQADAVPITAAEGTIAIDAQIQLTNGWRKTIPIVAVTPFTGTEASVAGTLQLLPVWDELDRLAVRTGMEWGAARVVISPRVHLTGQVNSGLVSDTVDKPFTFVLDKRQMRLDEPWRADRLQFYATSRIPVTRTISRTLPVLGWPPARLVTLSNVILGPALLVLVFAMSWDSSQRRYRRRAWEHARLGHSLRRGTLATIGESRTVVDLSSLHDLAVARGAEPVFLDESNGVPTYFVLRDDTAFLYRDTDLPHVNTSGTLDGSQELHPDHESQGTPHRAITSIERHPVGEVLTADVPLWLFPPHIDVRRSA